MDPQADVKKIVVVGRIGSDRIWIMAVWVKTRFCKQKWLDTIVSNQ